MILNWFSLIPPFVVLAIVMASNRIMLALTAGIISAGIIAAHGSLFESWQLIQNAVITTISNQDYLYLYGFLIVLGTLIALLTNSGATTEFARSVTKKITTPAAAEFTCVFLSFCLAIDDYLNIPTAGRIMNPLADRLGIARLKIAFLVHALAGPLVLMIPISSWAAAVVANIDQAGVSLNTTRESVRIIADPFFVYLWSLPFMLYSLCLFASIFFIIKYRLSFGPMEQYEKSSQINHEKQTDGLEGMSSLMMPLVALLISIFAGLAYTGGYSPYGQCTIIQAIKYNQDPFWVMFIAACIALITSIIISISRKKFSLRDLPVIFNEGFMLMYSGIVVVMLAMILAILLANHVGTGQYLALIMLGSMPLFLVPFMFFIVAFICTSTTGSAWGTFSLLIPIAIPLLTTLSTTVLPITPACLPLLFPALGAIFSGAVCGNHISPLADTTMLSALSTQTDPVQHSLTQLPYSMPAFIGSIVGFLVAGILVTHTTLSIEITIVITLGIGIGTCLCMLAILNRILHAK